MSHRRQLSTTYSAAVPCFQIDVASDWCWKRNLQWRFNRLDCTSWTQITGQDPFFTDEISGQSLLRSRPDTGSNSITVKAIISSFLRIVNCRHQRAMLHPLAVSIWILAQLSPYSTPLRAVPLIITITSRKYRGWCMLNRHLPRLAFVEPFYVRVWRSECEVVEV